MNAVGPDLKEQLKERLFRAISAQIDAIGYVPDDLVKLVGNFNFEADPLGQAPVPSESPAGESTAEADRLARRVNNHYDQVFYATDGMMQILCGDTEFRNIGYWNESTKTLNEASERLQDALLDFIPEKKGRILDVACGMGASTRRLLHYYPAQNVWAINISAKQIETTKKNAPGCHALVMNAVDLQFEDGFFDNIMCIEAAFHFETRRRFLEEARRVLAAGGRLVLSDVLFTSRDRLAQYPVFPSPDNHLESADEYRALLTEVGFRHVVIQDVTKEVWTSYFLQVVNRVHEEFCSGKLNMVELTEILWTYYHLNAIMGSCLFVCAQK